MRVSVVSDIHGNLDGLRRVADEAEFLIVLGDLLDYVDYYDPAQGILGRIFGEHRVRELIDIRARGDFDAFHAYDRSLWATLVNPEDTLREFVFDQYNAIIGMLGSQTLVTLGNVDMREVWNEVAPQHLRCLDGEVVDLAGLRIGFVGGGALKDMPAGSPWKSFDRHPDVFLQQLARLGSVDVLCTHVPPKIEDLRSDTIAHRHEMYGPGLVEYIDDHSPALALFGHVHHPRAAEATRGSTRCINVGYFKRRSVAYALDLPAITH